MPEHDDVELGVNPAGPQAALPVIGDLGDGAARAMELTEQLTAAHGVVAAGIDEDPDEELFQGFEGFVLGEDDELGEGLDEPVREPVYRGPAITAQAAIAGPRAGANAVVAPAAGGLPVGREPRWTPIYELAGYVGAGRRVQGRDIAGEAVRSLGRTIFRSMPCFRRMEEACRAAHRDPLGEVQSMANIAGRGPNSAAEMDAMAAWIRANGMMVDGARVEFPAMMAGYRPNLVLAASEDDSFLLVEERCADGAPADASYIYSWRGGRQVYLDSPDACAALQRMGTPQQQAAHLPPPPPAAIPQPAAPAAGLALPDARPVPRPVARQAAAPVARPAAPLPAAPRDKGGHAVAVKEADLRALVPPPPPVKQVAKAPIQVLRAAGWAPAGTPKGPVLRKDVGDGRTIEVRGADGGPLPMAKRFAVALVGADGDVVAETVLDGAEAVMEWAATPPAAGPRP